MIQNEGDSLVNWVNYVKSNIRVVDEITGQEVRGCQATYDFVNHSIVVTKDQQKWVFDANEVYRLGSHVQSSDLTFTIHIERNEPPLPKP